MIVVPQSGQTFFKHQIATVKTVKGRKGRKESAQVKSVRAQCVDRDGVCAIATRARDLPVGASWVACAGPSQWAHCHSKRRSKTRGMAPEDRHTTADSYIACEKHHGLYDAKRLQVRPSTRRGMDGPFTVKGKS